MGAGSAPASVRQVVDVLNGLVQDLNEDDWHRSVVLETVQRLESREFNLVIMGLFKRGKSTVINALLGGEVVPTGVVPLTSAGTLLTYGDTPCATVYYLDGHNRDIPLSDLAEYVTEEKNPCNQKQVSYVQVRWPSPFLQNGLRVVDTPGTGSTLEHNSTAARAWIPRADAIVFVLSVDPPISQEEIEYVKQMDKACRVVFALNKCDYASPDQLADILKFTTTALEQQAGAIDPTVIPISALMALNARSKCPEGKTDLGLLEASGILELRKWLDSVLFFDRDAMLVESATRKASTLLSQLEFETRLALEAAGADAESLEEKVKIITRLTQTMSYRRTDLEHLLDAAVQQLSSGVGRRLEDAYRTLLPTLDKFVDETMAAEENVPVHKLEEVVRERIHQGISNLMDEYRVEEQVRLEEGLEAIRHRFADESDGVVKDAQRTVSEYFDVQPPETPVRLELAEPKGFYYRYDTVEPTLHAIAHGLEKLLPPRIARERLCQRLKRQASSLLDMQMGRVRFDFARRIKQTTRLIERESLERISRVAEGLADALSMSMRDQGSEKRQSLVSELEAKLTRLGKLRGRLSLQVSGSHRQAEHP